MSKFLCLTRLAQVNGQVRELPIRVNLAHVVDVRAMGQGGTRVRTVLGDEINVKEDVAGAFDNTWEFT